MPDRQYTADRDLLHTLAFTLTLWSILCIGGLNEDYQNLEENEDYQNLEENEYYQTCSLGVQKNPQEVD